MDTIYSNKKYLQNLTAGSDYYRTSNSGRPIVQNNVDYTSYQNTMSRRSTLGAYTHMSKAYAAYPTDVSLSSHYGYNTWGVWRDSGNMSPTGFVKKKSVKSFSILLMTAACIVVLAVLAVAGLAFYFGTFRSDLDDSILVFDGSFRVNRGDVFTTNLKYNHTAAFRQKTEFYEKAINTALENNAMNVARTDVSGFGEGPLINVRFRVFLDMRKLPLTINNVESHIKNALLQELLLQESAFKNIKIDPETVEIKRLLDHEVLRTATFVREQYQSPNITSSVFEERLNKKSGYVEKTFHKFSTSSTGGKPPLDTKLRTKTQSHLSEPNIDMDNLPVIQGSFEVTKTEADITQKKERENFLTSPGTTSTLRPFIVSQTSIKINHKKKVEEKTSTTTTTTTTTPTNIEVKFDSILSSISALDIDKNIETDLKTKPTEKVQEKIMSSSTTLKTVVNVVSTSTEATTAESEEYDVKNNSNEDEHKMSQEDIKSSISSNVENLPKLDVSLFTSAPVIDHEPWRPINPSSSQKKRDPVDLPMGNNPLRIPSILEQQILNGDSLITKETNLFRNNNRFSDPIEAIYTESPQRPVYYQSYTNPTFSDSTLGIERLGTGDVRPYPIPVNKLYDDVIEVPDFKYIDPTVLHKGDILKLTPGAGISINYDGIDLESDKFEHLGDGVIVKKPEASTGTTFGENMIKLISVTPQSEIITKDELKIKPVIYSTNDGNVKHELETLLEENFSTEYSAKIGELLYDLLELQQNHERHNDYNKDKNEEEIEGVEINTESSQETTVVMPERLNFKNIKEHIMALKQNKTIDGEGIQRRENNDSVEDGDRTTPHPMDNILISLLNREKIENKLSKPDTDDKATPAYVEVETVQYTPGSDQNTGPQLFPSHSKWEFVNGSLITPNHGPMKKVFNETLQALVVENQQTGPAASNVKVEKKPQMVLNEKPINSQIQNISTIFDTLASKLGIAPSYPSKTPPFTQFSQLRNRNKTGSSGTKIKIDVIENKNNNLPARRQNSKTKSTTPATKTSTSSTTTPATTTSTSTTPRTTSKTTLTTTEAPITSTNPTTQPSTSTKRIIETSTTTEMPRTEPTIITQSTPLDEAIPIILDQSKETLFGEAEIEEVDPTQYEQMLRSQDITSLVPHIIPPTTVDTLDFETSTYAPFVTLLPVKSNSGLRTFRPPTKNDFKRRQFPSRMETIVRTAMNVNA